MADTKMIHEPSRRGFIGSMLGMFIGSQVPWIAATPVDKAIPQPRGVLADYRTYVMLADGIIQGPGVKEIRDGALILAPIKVKRDMKAYRSVVFYKNQLLSDAEFYRGPIVMEDTDTLKITHSVYVGIPGGRLVVPGDDDWDKWLAAYRLSQREAS